MNRYSTTAMAMVLAVAAGPLAAQTTTWNYAELDQDGNLELDQVEFEPAAEAQFREWDLNADEVVGEDEFYEGLYGLWDVDGDALLSEDEYADGWAMWFGEDMEFVDYEVVDVNADAGLTTDEFATGLGEADAYEGWTGDADLDQETFATGLYETYDVDADAALTEDEFAAMGAMPMTGGGAEIDVEEVISLSEWSYDDLYAGGASAEEFIDEMEVYGVNGEEIGDVEDVIIGANGQILAVIAEVGGFWDIGDTHVSIPWSDVEMGPAEDGIVVPLTEENVDEYGLFEDSWATAGRLTDEPVSDLDDDPLGPRAWRASELIGDYARLRDGDAFTDYGYVNDLILSSGEVSAVVVSPDVGGYGAGYRAYPFYGYGAGWGWTPGAQYYDMPYGANEVGDVDVFDYERMGG